MRRSLFEAADADVGFSFAASLLRSNSVIPESFKYLRSGNLALSPSEITLDTSLLWLASLFGLSVAVVKPLSQNFSSTMARLLVA